VVPTSLMILSLGGGPTDCFHHEDPPPFILPRVRGRKEVGVLLRGSIIY
jgi:hypothetical protein